MTERPKRRFQLLSIESKDRWEDGWEHIKPAIYKYVQDNRYSPLAKIFANFSYENFVQQAESKPICEDLDPKYQYDGNQPWHKYFELQQAIIELGFFMEKSEFSKEDPPDIAQVLNTLIKGFEEYNKAKGGAAYRKCEKNPITNRSEIGITHPIKVARVALGIVNLVENESEVLYKNYPGDRFIKEFLQNPEQKKYLVITCLLHDSQEDKHLDGEQIGTLLRSLELPKEIANAVSDLTKKDNEKGLEGLNAYIERLGKYDESKKTLRDQLKFMAKLADIFSNRMSEGSNSQKEKDKPYINWLTDNFSPRLLRKIMNIEPIKGRCRKHNREFLRTLMKNVRTRTRKITS